MKNKKLVLILLAAVLLISLCACKKDVPDEKEIISYDNIFVQQEAVSPYASAELLTTLEEGVIPYVNTNKNYDNAYIDAYGLLILQRTVSVEGGSSYTAYGFYSTKEKRLIIPVDFVEFSVNYGFIAVRKSDGKCSLYDVLGNAIFPESAGFSATEVDGAFRPISKDYIAVRASGGNYVNIYDKNGAVVSASNGGQLRYAGRVSELRAVDDYLVRTIAATKTTPKKVSIFKIGEDELVSITGETVTSNVNAFYLGNGNFYCYDIYEGSSAGYQYKADDVYYKATVWTYNAVSGEKKVLPLDTVFTVIINSYYAEEEGLTLDIESLVKEGYSFVSVGYTRDAEKNATFDQFIIDSDMNILLSMSSKLGTNVEYSADNEAYRDVLLTYIDDVGFSTTSVGELMLYDLYGNVVLRKAGVYMNTFYNSGIVTAAVGYEEGDKIVYYYGAFDLTGKEIFNAYYCKYAKMTPYVGNYALAETVDAKGNNICVLVDKSGIEHPVGGTIALTSSSKFIYKTGCYAVKETVSGTTYGIKAYDGTMVLDARFKNLVIASYGTNIVLVYAVDQNDAWNVYLLK